MKHILTYKFRSRYTNLIFAVILPVISLLLVEYFTHVPSDLTPPIFVVNLCVYYLIYLACMFFTGRTDIGYGLGTLIFLVFSFANSIVVSFRSAPIVPWDIYSVRTAMSVAGNYKLELNSHMIISLLGFLVVLFLCSKLRKKPFILPVRIIGTVISAVGIFLYTTAISSAPVINAVGLDTILFTPNVLYRNNGLVTGFLGILKYLVVDKPDHYSEQFIREIMDEVEIKPKAEEKQTEQLPNIIVIMNEAFSDLSVYGDLHTNMDYMPFIHSLTENTWKGNCYVSVKGGNTANSEYEFLTGNSMAFVPAGSVPYQQYIKSEIPTLASSLKNKGYYTAAIHPYNASGWNRNTVYPLLGFEEQYFKSSFSSPDTLRGYITDEEAFQKLIELYEGKTEGQPCFLFEVTMQNHGGYSKEYPDLEEEVLITDLPDKTTQNRAVEKYLTLMQKTDTAFMNLVQYFEQQEEKTIILMFGDHQPSDYITNVMVRLNHKDPQDEETLDLGYVVPYIMWSNYDTGTSPFGNLSLNYMNTLLMEKAGIPLTGYQSFEKELYQKYPVITANQLRDSRGKLLNYDLGEEELNKYACLSYESLCNKKDKKWEFFH